MSYYHPTYFSVSVTTQVGTGRQKAVPFPFLSRQHVNALVNGEPVPFTWIHDGLIELDEAPPEGSTVRVHRITPADEMLTVFHSPSNFRPERVNGAFLQLLYICQEAFDAALTVLDLAAAIETMYSQIAIWHGQIAQWYIEIKSIWDNATFDYIVNIPFRLSNNRVCASYRADEPMRVLAGLAGSRFWVIDPPANESVLHLVKLSEDGLTETPITTITFDNSSKWGTVAEDTPSDDVMIDPGETLIFRSDSEDWDVVSMRNWGFCLRTRRYPPLVEPGS